MRGGLGAARFGSDGFFDAVDDVVVDAVLHTFGAVSHSE